MIEKKGYTVNDDSTLLKFGNPNILFKYFILCSLLCIEKLSVLVNCIFIGNLEHKSPERKKISI